MGGSSVIADENCVLLVEDMEPAVTCPDGHYLANDGKCYPNQPAPAPAPEPEVVVTEEVAEEVAVGGRRRRGRKQRRTTRKQRKGTRKQRKQQRKSRKQQRKQQRKH